jgi:hypothetical protein
VISTVRPRRLLVLAVIGLFVAGACGSTAAPAPGPVPGPVPVVDHPTFPRPAAVFLAQDALPPVEELARYDVVVVDNEWAHRDPDHLRQLRARDPEVTLLAYVNLVDRPIQLGSREYYANRYVLWQFTDPTTSTFPRQWQARTASGAAVSEYPETTMTNLSDQAPRVGGQTFGEYGADWIADTVWASGMWDGIFLDVWGDTIYTVDRPRWDLAASGVDVPQDRIFGADGPWARGLTAAEQRMRRRMPDAIIVANGDRTLRDGLLNGRAWESFTDTAADRSLPQDLRTYLDVTSAGGARQPQVAMTINLRRAAPGSSQEFREARFRIAATLMQNGYWAPADDGYGRLLHYDELDGAGLGRGYLGAPVDPDPTPAGVQQPFAGGAGAVGELVFRRDFANGIVLVNAGDAEQTVQLGGPFRKLGGAQDPAVNDGSTVTSVTIPAQDGLILLR